MRFLLIINAMIWLTFPTLASELPDGYTEVGRYFVEIDGSKSEFISMSNEAENYSDPKLSRLLGGGDTYVFSGSLGAQDIPLLDIGIQRNGLVAGLAVVSITLIDKNYDTALAAFHGEYGTIQYNNIVIDDDGTVRFSFSSDLVRINLEDETPILGAVGAHIEGRFTGVIPASELR